MTFSILAVEPDRRRIGLAIASRFLAVGSYCLYARGGVGAVVTQGLGNPVLGVRGLERLDRGEAPAAALDALLAEDAQADWRQTMIASIDGRIAARTGPHCGAWAGETTDGTVAVAGNLLSGPSVVERVLEAFRASPSSTLADRLMDALAAGQSEGGDWRGMQAAALQVWPDECYPEVDLRVDDHPDPIAELRRLHRRHLSNDVQQVRATMPTNTNSMPSYPPVGDISASLKTNQELEE